MIELIFWSVMVIAFVGYLIQGWTDIEEWFWLRGARKEIRQMEKESHYERQDKR